MAYIEQAPQGEKTSPAGTEKLPITDGTNDWWIQILNLVTRKIRETGGPTVLDMGSVADGQFFKRSGSTIVGSSQLAMPRGHIWGLTISNNALDAVNDIDIAAGECRDVDNTEDIVLSSALTKQLDVNWAVGTNQGMLDTGVVADGTYHIFAIKRTDTGVVDVLASTSATSPTMPTNYTKKRRIGSIVRSGGSIKKFVQNGDVFMWDVPVADVNVTNPGTAAVTRTLTVPTGIRVEAILAVRGAGNTSTDNPQGVYISDLSVADSAPTGVLHNFYSYNGGAVAHYGGTTLRCFTNTSAQVRSRVQVSTANTGLVMITLGWVDTRGRLS